MARFPRTEPEVMALAEAMITGFAANAVLYPAPPVAVADLTTLKTGYITAKNAAKFLLYHCRQSKDFIQLYVC